MNALPRIRSQEGSVIVIVIVFVMVSTILGLGLYWLITSQAHSTELERTELKAFNVAEAGIDAGMLALKLDWPDEEPVQVDEAAVQTIVQGDEQLSKLWNPDLEHASEFIDVRLYDNAEYLNGPPDPIPHPDTAPTIDSNKDGKMFVDSTANVDNDRHRILILAERQKWQLTFPAKLALYANMVDSNGQGLEVTIENGAPPVYYDVHDSQHKGLDIGPGVYSLPSPTTFSSIFNKALQKAVEAIAKQQGTYFTSDTAASAFLLSGQAPGKVVYVKSTYAVSISGDSKTPIGTEDDPVVVVIDTPSGSDNVWDIKGTADFYGILVNIGDSTLTGTCGIHGALYCEGTLDNDGNGSSGEINYNEKCLTNINRQYTISVNIVPNTWEEYTLPRTSTTVASP